MYARDERGFVRGSAFCSRSRWPRRSGRLGRLCLRAAAQAACAGVAVVAAEPVGADRTRRVLLVPLLAQQRIRQDAVRLLHAQEAVRVRLRAGIGVEALDELAMGGLDLGFGRGVRHAQGRDTGLSAAAFVRGRRAQPSSENGASWKIGHGLRDLDAARIAYGRPVQLIQALERACIENAELAERLDRDGLVGAARPVAVLDLDREPGRGAVRAARARQDANAAQTFGAAL